MTTPVIDEEARHEARMAGFSAYMNLPIDREYDDTVADAIIEAYLTHAPQPDMRKVVEGMRALQWKAPDRQQWQAIENLAIDKWVVSQFEG